MCKSPKCYLLLTALFSLSLTQAASPVPEAATAEDHQFLFDCKEGNKQGVCQYLATHLTTTPSKERSSILQQIMYIGLDEAYKKRRDEIVALLLMDDRVCEQLGSRSLGGSLIRICGEHPPPLAIISVFLREGNILEPVHLSMAFRAASKSNNYNLINLFLSKPHIRLHLKLRPLLLARLLGEACTDKAWDTPARLELVDFVLKKGSMLSSKELQYAFAMACTHGKREIIAAFLSNPHIRKQLGPAFLQEKLAYCCQHSTPEVVALFLAHGNYEEEVLQEHLAYFCEHNVPEFVELFLTHGNYEEKVLQGHLQNACSNRKAPLFKVLLPHVVASEAFFASLLCQATLCGEGHIMQLLLKEKKLEVPMHHAARPAACLAEMVGKEASKNFLEGLPGVAEMMDKGFIGDYTLPLPRAAQQRGAATKEAKKVPPSGSVGKQQQATKGKSEASC